MTDEELDSFESACKAARDGNYGYNSKLFLELIAMIRQARDKCRHHEDYIAELEQSQQVYDKKISFISKLLDIEHDEGSYTELSYIYDSVERLQNELRQARAERDWMMRQLDSRKCCPNGKVCENEYPSLRMGCYPCWRKAAKEATCPKN